MSVAVPSRLREQIAGGDPLVGSFINLGSPLTTEIMAIAGFDWVVIDLEHGAAGEHALTSHLQALARTSTPALVRVEGIEAARFLHALDAGADGVLVPRLTSAEDARECVALCRYHGSRGLARSTRAWHWGLAGRDLAEIDSEIVCAVQIETAAALAAVHDIAAVDGVDVLFVGPVDLSHALGLPLETASPEMLERVAVVADAARANGKAAGMLVGSVADAERYRDLGFTFLGCASDAVLLAQGARRLASDMRGLVADARR